MVQVFQRGAKAAVVSHSRAMVWVIAFSLFLDYFLYGMLFPLAPHSPARLEGEGQFALLYGVYAASVLVVTPVFGYLGDRIGGRLTMLCGVILTAGTIALFGAGSSLFALLLAKFFQGAGSAGLWTSGLALIATNYSEKRVEMLGYAFAGGTFGSVIGPIAGGFLYSAGGYKMPFIVTGVLLAVAAALIAFLLPAGGTAQNETVDFRALMFNRSVIKPAIAVAVAAFSVGIIEPLLPVRLARFGTASMAIGIVFTVSSLVYGLSAPLVGRVSERMPVQRVILLGTIAMAIVLPFLSVFRGVIVVCLVLSLVNISFAFMLNPASAELGNVVDRSGMSCYSAVYAVYNIFYSIGMLAAGGLASAPAHLLSFRGVLLCASVILLLSIPMLTMADQPQRAVTMSSGG